MCTTDITYIATDEGWLYLVVMLDLYSRQVGGGLEYEGAYASQPGGRCATHGVVPPHT